jgi:hypothetical protein
MMSDSTQRLWIESHFSCTVIYLLAETQRNKENFIVVFPLRLCVSATAPALLYLRAPALNCESINLSLQQAFNPCLSR